MTYLLDTNICIYVIKRQPVSVLHRFQRLDVSRAGISSITLSELEYGGEKSQKPEQNRFALAEFLAPLEIYPYDDQAASAYGPLRATLEKKGTLIGSLDLLIAAHALALKSILVTNNEKEFRRIPGLTIENWVK
jgi:tRNA(fMet)-specific endonuclease VapC